MKTFIAAMALVIALPAAANAQAAQHQAQQGNHAHHEGMDHGKEHKDCCKHKNADGTAMACCKEKDGKKPACCDKQDKGGQHSGHKMNH